MIIILLGYMGSGKSTVGKALANTLKYKLIDLDNYIEVQQKTSISRLFQTTGEIQFRKIEAKAVREILKTKTKTVLATGGGTPCYSDNMQFLQHHPKVYSIYLKASVKTLNDRLIIEKSKRPLIANISDNMLSEFIAKHLFERSIFYSQAKFTIEVDSLTTEKIIEAILRELD